MKLKNKKTQPSKFRYIIIATLALVVLGGVGVAAYTINKTNNAVNEQKKADQISPEGINYGDATDEQIQAGADQKGQSQNDQPPAPDPSDPINVVVTALNPPSAANPTLQIRVRIDMVTSTGSCTLELKKGDSTITKQADIQAGPTTSTCQGFDVAGSELTSGSWSASIKVVSGNQEGTISEVFTVQ